MRKATFIIITVIIITGCLGGQTEKKDVHPVDTTSKSVTPEVVSFSTEPVCNSPVTESQVIERNYESGTFSIQGIMVVNNTSTIYPDLEFNEQSKQIRLTVVESFTANTTNRFDCRAVEYSVLVTGNDSHSLDVGVKYHSD